MGRHLRFQINDGRQLLQVDLPEKAKVHDLILVVQQELGLAPETMRLLLPKVKGPALRLRDCPDSPLIDLGESRVYAVGDEVI